MRNVLTIAFLVVLTFTVKAAFAAEAGGADATFVNVPPGVTIPAVATQGEGAWRIGGYVIATGKGVNADVLGEAKGRRIQRDFAEQDVKNRILVTVAAPNGLELPPSMYIFEGNLSGMVFVSNFHLQGKDDLFLIGLVKEADIKAKATLQLDRVHDRACELFEQGKFPESSRYWNVLEQNGVKDAETVAWAQASAWHVDLETAEGPAKVRALTGLVDFYLARKKFEPAYHMLYMVYTNSASPSRDLLNKLVHTCDETQRKKSAAAFRAEIAARWPPVVDAEFQSDVIREAIATNPWLFEQNGAGVCKVGGKSYFIAVGSAGAKGDSPIDKLNQIKVARIRADAAVAEFIKGAQITVREHIEKTTITTKDTEGHSASVQHTTIDDTTLQQVKGIIPYLDQVGTWKSPDRALLFIAIGRQLDLPGDTNK